MVFDSNLDEAVLDALCSISLEEVQLLDLQVLIPMTADWRYTTGRETDFIDKLSDIKVQELCSHLNVLSDLLQPVDSTAVLEIDVAPLTSSTGFTHDVLCTASVISSTIPFKREVRLHCYWPTSRRKLPPMASAYFVLSAFQWPAIKTFSISWNKNSGDIECDILRCIDAESLSRLRRILLNMSGVQRLTLTAIDNDTCQGYSILQLMECDDTVLPALQEITVVMDDDYSWSNFAHNCRWLRTLTLATSSPSRRDTAVQTVLLVSQKSFHHIKVWCENNEPTIVVSVREAS